MYIYLHIHIYIYKCIYIYVYDVPGHRMVFHVIATVMISLMLRSHRPSYIPNLK